ncbi:hypothetical protein [Cytobacillus oceanisediminis]|uniref:hypothetical protein n=1 Tax=Cytobacillus oceanisediminis TaxID=665099 RepID=UPI00203C0617|nr:hypothetical protein [Cytobacillus oceanisediminis]MCM3393148.1 hypothetical protein [Cytobacillus oceanisediminis]
MESKLNDSILKGIYQFNTESQCLFIQKWRELLFYKTINSYQYKLRNIHSILSEIKNLINDIKLGTTISISNLKDLILETKKLLEKDIVIRKHYRELLGSLSSGLKPSISEKNELLKLEYRVNYALEIISPTYLENIINDLHNAIVNNETEIIEPLIETLTTQLINSGWSSRSLHRLGKVIFLTKNDQDFDTKWEKFLNLIKADKGLYHCYFEVQIDEGELKKFESAGIRVVSGLDIIQSFEKIGSHHIKESGFYIEEEAEAFHEDMYTAVNNCKHKISLKQSVLSFYGTKVIFQNAVNIIFPNEEKLVPFRLIDGNSLFYEPSEEDILTTSQTIKNELINKDDRIRLQNFYRQYAVSISTSSNETTFSSLWSALESLLVTGHHQSNIEHIKKIVPSVMCSRFVPRLLKNFLYDCNRVGVQPSYKGTRINTATPGEQDLKALFNIFKDETEYQNLITNINDYVLLNRRCIELKNDLENSETLNKLMTGHYNTISMHIQRLYRVRNNLVHSANVEKDIDLLVEHLHFYTRSTISELVHRLTWHNFKSLGELFMIIEDNYYALIEILKENIKNSPKKNIKDYDPDIIFSGPIFNYA